MSTTPTLGRKPTQTEWATALLTRLGVPLPSFAPHKRNSQEAVNPMRRARTAIKKHFGLNTGRAWRRFRRWAI